MDGFFVVFYKSGLKQDLSEMTENDARTKAQELADDEKKGGTVYLYGRVPEKPNQLVDVFNPVAVAKVANH